MQRTRWLCLFLLCLSGCTSTTTPQTVDTLNINQLENASQANAQAPVSVNIGQMRHKLLTDTAMSIGAQSGLAWAAEKINVQLAKDKTYLSSVFNFNAMMLSHGVLPPVLVEGSNSLNLADPTTVRVADKTYHIITQARFTTTPPNWREYLWLTFSKPELPDKTLLPRDPEEQKIWKAAVHRGFEKGIEQAYSIFQQNLARLKRDYQGMILYRKLLEQNMINAPFVSRTELGVTGNGNDMRVNDQVLRIVDLPQLQTETKHWNAIVVKQ